MKIILALIFLPFFTYSQVNYEIEYDVQLNSLSRKGYLFLNKKSNPHYYEVSAKDSLKKQNPTRMEILKSNLFYKIKQIKLGDNYII